MALMGKKIYDWSVIAIDYDAGMSWDAIHTKYGCGHEAIHKAIKTGKLVRRPRLKPRSRGGRKPLTKEQNSAYCKAHYRKNIERYKARALRNSLVRATKCRAIILERFKFGCVDCGIADPIVLEFDHRDRAAKVMNISVLSGMRQANENRLRTELEKCDVRCANCHRRKTAIECRSWRTKLALGTGVDPVIPGPQPSGFPLA